MPPPVDPGEAPMNMSTETLSSPAEVNSPRGNVEKPAVLADTLVKNAPSQVISSVSQISTVPDAKVSGLSQSPPWSEGTAF